MAKCVLFVQLFALSLVCACIAKEPVCTSRFDFEEKLLQKMVRMEHSMELLKDEVSKQLSDIVDERKVLMDDFRAFQDLIKKEQIETKQKLESSLTNMKASQDIIKTEQNDVRTEMIEERANLQASLKTLTNENNELFNNSMVEMAERIDKVAPTGEAVAFSVQDPKPDLVDGIPVFSTVLVNEGDAYDVNTGKFTCPVDGIYTFTFALRSSSSGYTYCHIRLNGKNTKYAISTGDNNMASISIILKLKVKDVVNIGGCSQWSYVNKGGVLFSGRLDVKN